MSRNALIASLAGALALGLSAFSAQAASLPKSDAGTKRHRADRRVAEIATRFRHDPHENGSGLELKCRILPRAHRGSRFFKSLLNNEVALNFVPHCSASLTDRKKFTPTSDSG